MVKDKSGNEVLEIAKALLADEKFISVLVRRISAGLEKIGHKPITSELLWQDQLDSLDMPIAKDCTAKTLEELYSLTPGEIENIGARIRTGEIEGELTLETVREQVLAQLGDDVLMKRVGRAEHPMPQGRKRCGDDYECGYPYYCGNEVHCGTPYELIPCGVLYDYACRPQKGCPPIYYRKRDVAQEMAVGKKHCGIPHRCAQLYYCGAPYHCGWKYECGPKYEMFPDE